MFLMWDFVLGGTFPCLSDNWAYNGMMLDKGLSICGHNVQT